MSKNKKDYLLGLIELKKSVIIYYAIKKKEYVMQYIVLDLEWNQALSRESMRRKGFTLVGEIIQIGAVRLNSLGGKPDTIRLVVAPKYYKKIHWSVRKLTGISTKTLAQGLPFPDAYKQFMDWCGEDAVFLTWGPDDLPMLRDNIRLHNMSASALPDSFDLQRIFARQFTGKKQQFSLADAMKQLNIPQTIPAHDALNDALNTAEVCRKLDLENGITHYDDPFPRQKKTIFEDDSLPRTIYQSYAEMAETEFDTPSFCPMCGKDLTLGKWVRRASGKRITLAVCPCGQKYILKIRWKIDEESEHVFATRQLEEATDEQIAAYQRTIRQRRRTHHRKSKTSSGAERNAK